MALAYGTMELEFFHFGNEQNSCSLFCGLLGCSSGNAADRLALAGGAASVGSPLCQNRQASPMSAHAPVTARRPPAAPRAGGPWIEMSSRRAGSCPLLGWKHPLLFLNIDPRRGAGKHLNTFSVDNEAVYLILFGSQTST